MLCQVFIILRFDSEVGKGIEPHPTDEYHSVFFLTALRLMERPLSLTQPCRRELSGSQSLSQLSTYIISKLAANVKGLLIFYLIIIFLLLLPCSCYKLSLVFNPCPSSFFSLQSSLEGGLSVEASPLKLRKQSLTNQLVG